MAFRAEEYLIAFNKIYGSNEAELNKQVGRFEQLYSRFIDHYGDGEVHLFSTPGRTELGGNHTDHNHGRVLAASVNLDSIAIASRTNDNVITLYSLGYEAPFVVDLKRLEINYSEKETTTALIRGIAARFKESGYNIGGFNAAMQSQVLPGSGLSSSASIEVLIGTIMSELYNRGEVPPEEIAKIGQYAENHYFGKPCGLMDQVACATGGVVSIDFKDPDNPVIEKIDFDLSKHGHSLLIVNTGGSHSDLTEDYASVPAEMKQVAAFFRADALRDISSKLILDNMLVLRKSLGDRAVLRALHFLQENERVINLIEALKKRDFKTYLKRIEESGNSSFKWLQNIYSIKNAREQGLTLALAITETFIADIDSGACRVHGGGFAGTIQVYLPDEHVADYVKTMEQIFGDESVYILNIRSVGSVEIKN